MITQRNTWTIARILLMVFLLAFRLAGGREWFQELMSNAPQVGQASVVRVVNALVYAGLLAAALMPLIVFFFVDHGLRREWAAAQDRLAELRRIYAWRAQQLDFVRGQINAQVARLNRLLQQQQEGREAVR